MHCNESQDASGAEAVASSRPCNNNATAFEYGTFGPPHPPVHQKALSHPAFHTAWPHGSSRVEPSVEIVGIQPELNIIIPGTTGLFETATQSYGMRDKRTSLQPSSSLLPYPGYHSQVLTVYLKC